MNHSHWQKAEVYRSHCRRDMQRFLLSFWQFFLPTHCRSKLKKFRICLGIFLPTYLAPEFRKPRKYGLPAYGFLKSNVVRYDKYCRDKFPEPSKIPSTKDNLHQHVKHVSYEAFVQKNALEAKQEILDTNPHDWNVKGLIKAIGWTIKLPLRRY